MSFDKALIRKDALARREALDDTTRLKASSLIRQKLFLQDFWRQANTILCYVSYRSEVDTHALIKEAVRFNKCIVTPIFNPENPDITEVSELMHFGDLAPGAKGILEPRPDAVHLTPLTAIDLILVPGALFDRQGNRLGYGVGYFDRLLSRAPRAKRVGLAYSSQIYDGLIAPEPHDIPMHAIQTETETILIP